MGRAATLTRNVELLLNDRAAVRLSDANDVDFECPLELDDPQNHLLREASEAEWNELEHVTIRLSQGREIMLQATWRENLDILLLTQTDGLLKEAEEAWLELKMDSSNGYTMSMMHSTCFILLTNY